MRSDLVRLIPYALSSRRSRGRLGIYLLCLLLASMAATAVPLLFRQVVDRGLARSRPTVALDWTLGALAISIIAAGSTALSGWLGAAVGQDLTYRLRLDLYRHISAQPVGFFAQSRAGVLTSRISADAVQVQGLIQSLLGTLVGQGLTFVVATVGMVTLDPAATLVAITALPLFLLPIRPFGRRLRAAGVRQAEARALVQHHLTEQLNVEGALAREVFGAHDHDLGRFDAAVTQLRDAVISRNANFYASSFFLTALGGFGVASVYGVASLGAGRSVSIGTVVALAGLVGLMYQPMIQLATQGIGLLPALVSLERVYEVLDHGESYESGQARLIRPARLLRLQNVWFRHPGPEVTLPTLRGDEVPTASTEWTVRDLSVDLAPGVTALVGLTGAGKTTTALLACGVYRPTRGRVTLDGTDLDQLEPGARRSAIGVLTQDPFVLHASLRENLLLAAPDADDDQLAAVLRRARLLDAVAAMPDGLDTVIGDRGYRLSGGERQRLALARILLTSPDVLIMDEATAHLDTRTERAIIEAIDQLAPGTIRLVIAHRLSTVRSADQIVVLHGGQIVERGTHDQLMAVDSHYAALVRAAVGSGT